MSVGNDAGDVGLGECRIRGNDRRSVRPPGCRCEHGVEHAEAVTTRVEPQTFSQVILADDQQRSQEVEVVARETRGVLAVATSRADVDELL